MASKFDYLPIQYNPSTITIAQLTTALNNQGQMGYRLILVQQVTSTKAFAIFERMLSK